MPPNHVLKYILDIEAVIAEIEDVIKIHDKNYVKFSSNFMAIRTVERDLEIIGEAVKKITSVDSAISITSVKDIIGLRNIIVHAYDAIDPTTLWKIIIIDLPILKLEIQRLKG